MREHNNLNRIEKIKNATLNTDDTLVIIIDMQDKLLKAMSEKDKVEKNCNILVEASDILEVPTIFTAQYPKGLGNVNDKLLSLSKNKIVYDKRDFTIYVDEIKEDIESKKRINIVIAGIETHVCVLQSARDLLENGYNVFIVEDAVSSRNENNKKAGLKYLKSIGATIITTEMFIFDMLKTSDHKDFKSVQNLIK